MQAFLQENGYAHDLFVSYAHLDNAPIGTEKKGWVATFTEELSKILSRKLGKPGFIWKDERLAGHEPLTQAILDAIQKTGTLLVIMSNGYLQSSWCRKEREEFIRIIKNRSHQNRIFIIEIDQVDHTDTAYPAEFHELIGYRFWVQDPDTQTPLTLGFPKPDEDYYKRLNELAQEIADELKKIKGQEDTTEWVDTVFLAEVTDDLEPKRDELKRFLTQAHYKVLPEKWYPRDNLTTLRQHIAADLSRSRIFIQLLSEVVGKVIPDTSLSFPRLQFDCALAANKKILQWCAPNTPIEKIENAAHRELFQTVTLQQDSLEDFKNAVLKSVAVKETLSAPSQHFFYISVDPADYNFAKNSICTVLDQHHIGYALPRLSNDPVQVRKYLEVNLLNCDGAFFVYCHSDQSSVLNQILQCRKIMAQREEPIRAVAVYDGPPPEKEDIAFNFPNMYYLKCRDNQESLEKFLLNLS